MLETTSALISIIIFDLILSGDNAVVIGMAARRLSPENRRKAIIFGGAGAVGLRILFTAMAALLLDMPYIQFIGGILLLWIAYKLLKPHESEHGVREAGSLREAIQTIVLADVVMSLDNILAVGAAAHGKLWLLLFGLGLSIPILLLGSDLVARLLGNFPLLVYVGAAILVWAAVRMMLHDTIIHDNVYAFSFLEALGVAVLVNVVVLGLGIRAQRQQVPVAHHSDA